MKQQSTDVFRERAMTEQTEQSTPNPGALDRLVNREEILQICYWYQGEGLGNVYSAKTIQPFLNYDEDLIEIAFKELIDEGCFELATGSIKGYSFTEKGKTQGGRLFADSFADFQKAGHGECAAGCCDDGDHSQCGDDCALH